MAFWLGAVQTAGSQRHFLLTSLSEDADGTATLYAQPLSEAVRMLNCWFFCTLLILRTWASVIIEAWIGEDVICSIQSGWFYFGLESFCKDGVNQSFWLLYLSFQTFPSCSINYQQEKPLVIGYSRSTLLYTQRHDMSYVKGSNAIKQMSVISRPLFWGKTCWLLLLVVAFLWACLR